MILDRILKHKRWEVKDKKNARYLADLKTKIRDAPAPIGFYEARAHLADAVLLIVAALDRAQLIDFYHLARQEFGLDVLLEVHHERELDLVLERLPKVRIIGINNRDLTTFVTSLDVTLRLATRIPKDKLIVSESGIFTRDDVRRVAEADVRALLVRESLMTAKDVGAKIKELIGRERSEERRVGKECRSRWSPYH